MTSAVALETVRLASPLGVRFFDPLTQKYVADGLRVSAHPLGRPGLSKRSVVNRSATHTFHALPGLHESTFRDSTEADSSAPAPLPFCVEVLDDLQRFLPFSFEALLPQRGLFQLNCGGLSSSVPPEAAAIELFSAPARSAPRHVARVYAQLWDSQAAVPAAFAIIEARRGGVALGRGMSDRTGNIAVFLPYPEPTDLPGTLSSAFPLSPPLVEQRWQLELDVFYRRQLPEPAVVDLCATLGQPRCSAWADQARTTLLDAAELSFGHDLVLRTQGLSTLLLTSA